MPSVSEMASNVFVLDNGGYTIKAGFSTNSEPRIIPNCITKAKSERRRQFIGTQLDECKDFSGLYYAYPTQRGYMVNWDIEKQVWDHVFSSDHFNVDFKETCIIVTEPYFNFVAMQESMVEILFEDYKFHSIYRVNAGTLSAYKSQRTSSELCCLVVDSGFSFTHIIPYIKGKKLKNSTRRIDVGGKILTNHLKEIISYRQLNVMDETYVMNQVKEDVCYVSTDFWNELKVAKLRSKENTIVRDYVLPDYTVIRRGYVRPLEETTGKPKDNEQLIRMNNERFMVPEILFHPSDVNIREMGISEAIVHVIESCPEEIRPHLYKNIVLTGGNACFPGFKERVYNDVRCEAPSLCDVKVILPENPVTNAWEGGTLIPSDPEFHKLIVTRKQFEENGINFCLEKFDV
ncbi:actin-related protein 6 [Trichonephila inaurata madagascariensis]|uniref:Actin-related protein 6 n=1 Tax=Trichonephila inaurata madagascariensis TaxID=2747483 RepID=A0A8X6IZ09_9ARAC|nr:actin-related protein 6 [Trichonephila inaurata madagascariensis]